MDTPGFAEQREELLQSIERDEQVVRVAVQDLTEAAEAKLDITQSIKAYPLTWAISAFLVGVLLGSRGMLGDKSPKRRAR